MRKTLRGFLRLLVAAGIIMLFLGRIYTYQHGFAVISCVSDRTAISVAQMVKLGMTEHGELDTEGIGLQIVYQLAKRSIVKVVVKDAAGSGIIWKIEDGIVIASNKHLLMKDVKAEIVFGNGETIHADILGYAQQYDIGFVKIPEGAVTDSMLRDIYEAVPALYETETEEARTAFISEYSDKRVLQLGAFNDGDAASLSTGNIKGISFVPLFNTHMLETACFSKAGMSGGGVFDESGQLLAMISGGDVPEDAEKREAEITYSIPSSLIVAAYEEIMDNR